EALDGDDPEGAGGEPLATQERFVAVDGSTQGASPDPAEWGIWDRKASDGDGALITNFSVLFERAVQVVDEFESTQLFRGTLSILGRALPFEVSDQDYASNDRLRAAIFSVAGPEAQIHCKMELLRTAISALSRDRVVRKRMTRDFGW